VGPEEDVVVDRELTSQLDWEVELAVVLGRGGLRIPASRALEYVCGYAVLNDLSARDLQGFGQDPPVFLEHGDVAEAEVSRIGAVRNRIRFEG
jgi:2-keto-4-pentenoate hydratase/2-oxohepta-3-ene-1,7-dioic acid hydratase in catechol pathway